ncbi:esterase-like activity of phytase family protein [Histidinibacterium lentulum]|uniref:Esterase-like activity of phytase family protein n=2 Tax=Histidinibacterium lentulum TaxID=2480588 RepID=A0A3N2R1G2_9RHOB|nr:esterase-like activity of phytase family protein [Histidinibacterium lentulum]
MSPQAEYLGTHVWQGSHVGGVSGIELSANGMDFLAINDRSVIYRGRLDRVEGRIVGVSADAYPLLDLDGETMRGDSEGLAIGPDGRIFVSFEGRARVWSYDAPGTAARPTAPFPDLGPGARNRGLEALAITADGTLITISEGTDATGHHPVWTLAGGSWQVVARIAPTRFVPVGADIGPDGELYLLERRFTYVGFQTRVRRIGLETGTTETVIVSRVGQHDNLEGLSVWRDETGALRLTMVADDNFNLLQQTEIVEYRLDGGTARP